MNYIEKIKKSVKKMPKPIERMLSVLYNMLACRIVLDRDMINILAEYFSLPEKEILWLLNLGQRLNADFWRFLNPKTQKEIENFYRTTPFYIFDLAKWHMETAQVKFRKSVIDEAEGRVLEVGAGIGDLCAKLAEKGLETDYNELEGMSSSFAKWLFRKKKLNIGFVNLSDVSKQYDTIICIDVIEHVVDPKGTLETLTRHLKKDGKMIITKLNFQDNSKLSPMHINFDVASHDYFTKLGLLNTKYDWLFIKK